MIDPTNPPLGEPKRVTVGSTVKWRRSLPNMLPPTWTVTYAFSNGTDQVAITTSNNGDGTHLAEIATDTFAEAEPGPWSWRAYASDGTDRYDVGAGEIELEPDLTDGAADVRSFWVRLLAAIDALLEGKATSDQQQMTFRDRSLQRFTWDQLLAAREVAARHVRQERLRRAQSEGKPASNRIKFRFAGRAE